MGKRRSAKEIALVRARLKTEFVSNLSSPGKALDDMPLASKDQCQWRCSAEDCGHQWPTRLQFRTRTLNPTGCPACSKRRNRAPGPGESLADLNPALARQFRRNLSRPGRDPDTLRPQSHDLCEWECAQGHFWPAKLANRTNGRGCPDCTGHGRSPFECNVAMLVEAASGLSVELDHRLHLPGRQQDRFDLYLPQPAPGLLIDLDPEWTHNRPGSLERDTAKTMAALAAGLDVERIRSRGLPPVPVHGFFHNEAGPSEPPRLGGSRGRRTATPRPALARAHTGGDDCGPHEGGPTVGQRRRRSRDVGSRCGAPPGGGVRRQPHRAGQAPRADAARLQRSVPVAVQEAGLRPRVEGRRRKPGTQRPRLP